MTRRNVRFQALTDICGAIVFDRADRAIVARFATLAEAVQGARRMNHETMVRQIEDDALSLFVRR